MTATTTRELSAHQERRAALTVLEHVESLIPTGMGAALGVDDVTHAIRVRLSTNDPEEGRALAALLHLFAEKPVTTRTCVHHVWSGPFGGRRVRVSVLVALPGVPLCQCEHEAHFGEGDLPPIHAYGQVPAGEQKAQHVGAVCDACAYGHVHDHLIPVRS